MSNINGIPLTWDTEADKKLLGKLFPGAGTTSFLNNILTGQLPGYESPLLDYDWQTYWSNDLAAKFFNNKTVTDSDDPIEITDETAIYKSLTPIVTSILYPDTNNNNKFDKWEKSSMKIKIFISDDGAKLLRAWHGVTPKADELLLFFKNTGGDPNSNTELLSKAGTKAQDSIKDNAENSNIFNWVNSKYTITQEQLTTLLRSAGSISLFMRALKFIVKGVAKIISWPIEWASDFFYWVGNKIEKNLRIADETWQAPPPDIKKWIVERQKTITDTFKNFFDDWEKDDPGNASRQTLATHENIIKQVMAGVDKFLGEFIANAPEMIFAAICGIINGIVDMIAGIFTLIGLILKIIAGVIRKVGDVVAEMEYYISLMTEYAENITRALNKIDWSKVITDAYSAYFKFVYETLPQLIEKTIDGAAKIKPVEIAYYVGYIGINIVVCFIPVVDLVQLAKIEKLAKPLQALFEIVTKLINKGGSFVATSAGSLFTLIETFTALLAKGTDEVITFVKRVFEAIKAWLEELLGYKIVDDIAAEDIDWLERKSTTGNLGGKIVTVKQIRKLKALLSKEGIELILEEKAIYKKYYRDLFYYMRNNNKVGGFSYIEKKFVLLKNTTEIVVFHEQCHVEHWKQLGEVAYKALSELDRETYAWEQIYKNKNLWTEAELLDALDYINRIRVRNFDLGPLKIKL